MKPSMILSKLCKEKHLDPPHYRLHMCKVTVAGKEFTLAPGECYVLFSGGPIISPIESVSPDHLVKTVF